MEACSHTFRAIWRTHVCRGNDFERRKLFLFKGKTSTGNNPSELLPEIDIDAEINFADITPKRILKQFDPLNMTPVFLTKNIKDTGYAKKRR
jgi:single-stranded-DNA-specific exonuclease